MADYATKTEVQSMIDKAVDDLTDVIRTFMTQVDKRMSAQDKEWRKQSLRHERRYEAHMAFLEGIMRKYENRFDSKDTDDAVRDARLDRLELKLKS